MCRAPYLLFDAACFFQRALCEAVISEMSFLYAEQVCCVLCVCVVCVMAQ